MYSGHHNVYNLNSNQPSNQMRNRISGRVKMYNKAKGFGFIKLDNTNQDLYFNIKQFKNASKIPSLNEKVEFEIGNGHKGFVATNITFKSNQHYLNNPSMLSSGCLPSANSAITYGLTTLPQTPAPVPLMSTPLACKPALPNFPASIGPLGQIPNTSFKPSSSQGGGLIRSKQTTPFSHHSHTTMSKSEVIKSKYEIQEELNTAFYVPDLESTDSEDSSTEEPEPEVKKRKRSSTNFIEEGAAISSVNLVCKLCEEEPASITFSPCSHKIFCHECSTRVKRCIHCYQLITKKIKSDGTELIVAKKADARLVSADQQKVIYGLNKVFVRKEQVPISAAPTNQVKAEPKYEPKTATTTATEHKEPTISSRLDIKPSIDVTQQLTEPPIINVESATVKEEP